MGPATIMWSPGKEARWSAVLASDSPMPPPSPGP